MDTVTVIGCIGDAWYSKIIQKVEHGQYTHIAGIILNSTLESQGIKDKGDRYPGVWLHPPDKYIDGQNCRFFKIRVSDLRAMEDMARIFLGTLYGFPDCVDAGLKMLFNIEPPTDGTATMMCSEVWDRLLQAGKPPGITLPDYIPDFVAPQRLIDAISAGAL